MAGVGEARKGFKFWKAKKEALDRADKEVYGKAYGKAMRKEEAAFPKAQADYLRKIKSIKEDVKKSGFEGPSHREAWVGAHKRKLKSMDLDTVAKSYEFIKKHNIPDIRSRGRRVLGKRIKGKHFVDRYRKIGKMLKGNK